MDDFIVISEGLEQAYRDQAIVVGLLRFLGFHVSYEKVTSPSKCTVFLGLEIDAIDMEFRLPLGKLQKLNKYLKEFSQEGKNKQVRTRESGWLVIPLRSCGKGWEDFIGYIRT